jgi:TonB family protein
VSGMLHVVLLGAAVLNLSFFNRPPLMEPEPVMVDFEMVAQKAAAPKVGNPPPQPKDVPIAEQATKAPPPKSAEPPPAPEKPKPDVAEAKPLPPPPVEKPKPETPKPAEDLIALKPKEPEPPKVEKPPEPPKPAPEVKKPEPPKPAPPKPQQQAAIAVPPANPNPRPPPPPQPRPTPQIAPSPLSRIPQQQRPSAVARGRDAPQSSPFVNPADTYNTARVGDNYLWEVVRKLQGYEYFANNSVAEAVTVVSITVARDGRLLNVAVLSSSGYPEMDRGVVAGVRQGSPYTPLPDSIQGPSATFRLPLVSSRAR